MRANDVRLTRSSPVRLGLLSVGALLLLAGADRLAERATGAEGRIFFDDFGHADRRQLEARGWIVRTAPGWPGVRGATWTKNGVSLVNDPSRTGNRLLRLASSTRGSASSTTQAQVCQQRKFREGTYAARVRFRDAPASGPDGDRLVESFYAISPLKAPMDPDYSETDFEYLPNGGWGRSRPTLYVTTWETFRPEPHWFADNTSANRTGSQSGWHTLVLQVGAGRVTYYLDGARLASHTGRYYPEVPMSINFNLWFLHGGLLRSRKTRRYEEDVDWVFHEAGAIVSPRQVGAAVAELRRASIAFRDTVPAPQPQLRAPCNL